jgi:hypothetical protein
MRKYNRRQFLIALACSTFSLSSLYLGAVSKRQWIPREVDWDTIINDVIGNTNAVLSGVSKELPSYEIGGPHWCMERALAREFIDE